MTNKPVVFISATSDLRPARDLVGRVLYSMGFEPVWQDIEPTDGGELLDVLRKRLEPAAIVIQLVGRRYGAEPPQPTKEFGRVSYTQFEALEAKRLGKKVIYHCLDDRFPIDPAEPEPPELASLQAAYLRRLKDTNCLRYDQIADTDELELSIRRISDELAALRRQSDRRFRNFVRLCVGGFAILAVLVFALLYRQNNTIDTLEMLVELSGPNLAAAGQPQPRPTQPAADETRQTARKDGTAEDQELDKVSDAIFGGNPAEADRLIQQLKSKPGNSNEKRFLLFTLEGNNWYQAGEPDKAIEPYVQALSLMPDDLKARNRLACGLISARLGDVAEQQQRAIGLCEGVLKLLPSGSADLARTQYDLGIAWWTLSTADKANQAEHLKKAMEAYQAALTVYTKDAYPQEWARTQENLGLARAEFPTEDKREQAKNLEKALAAYKQARTVLTKNAYASDWAGLQNNFGNAWWSLSSAAATNQAENQAKAIEAFKQALTVYTKDLYPDGWARTQENLGVAWSGLSAENQAQKAENLNHAIEACQAALTVYTKDTYPADWSKTQRTLGNAWRDLFTGDRTENLKRAIVAYQAALTVPSADALTQRSTEIDLSWAQLLAKDFAGALDTTNRAASDRVVYLPLEANHAHSLLLLGRTDEARAMYLKYVGKKVDDTDKTWEQFVLDDFNSLEQSGIESPEFAKLRKLLEQPAKTK